MVNLCTGVLLPGFRPIIRAGAFAIVVRHGVVRKDDRNDPDDERDLYEAGGDATKKLSSTIVGHSLYSLDRKRWHGPTGNQKECT
jgi:hypothetical protein